MVRRLPVQKTSSDHCGKCVQVVEAGLGFLPFTELTVTTPTGSQYCGVDFAKSLCGVSIIRSGESMENALRACCKGIKIGKILVHRYSLNCDIPILGKLLALYVMHHMLWFCRHDTLHCVIV